MSTRLFDNPGLSASPLIHPSWCAESYRCTAVHPRGEHLSRPWVLPAGAGGRVSTVVSLVQRRTDLAPLVEVRLRIRLTARDETGQARQIRRLLVRLCVAVAEAGRAGTGRAGAGR